MSVRRRDVLKGAAAGAAVLSAPFIITSKVKAADTIRIGVALDLTGPLGIFGVNKKRCLDLALDNVIAVGSLDGSVSVLSFGDREGAGGDLRHRDAP